MTDRLDGLFRNLRGVGKLSVENIKESLGEVRRALLEADVNYKVVKRFVAAVEARAIGEEVLKSIDPGQLIVKIVHDEMVEILGRELVPLAPPTGMPTTYMICGLQGSGKTTLSAKLALDAKNKKAKALLVAADTYRPAAVQQLKTLGEQIDVEVFSLDGALPPEICRKARKHAERNFVDLLIYDTAGRLQIDAELMNELQTIKSDNKPEEILLVVDSMTGQEAVNVAAEFHTRLQLTGVALSKLDGDARGGAAISIRAITDCPIKVASVGEKVTDLERFHPDRMASRILGMGDVVTLVEKAQDAVDLDQAEKMEEKLRKNAFDLEDFLDQMQALQKMGPLDSVLGMIPGVGSQMRGAEIDPKQIGRVKAIIQSMTPDERHEPRIIDGSRRRRIAAGSGNTVQDVNKLLKQFTAMKKMMKSFTKQGKKGLRAAQNPLAQLGSFK
ncbi:MAG: signal recognition particle protein [Candidatus Zixiibacteriota bacterium]